MKIPIYQIDTFTDKVYGGNAAAVCPLEKWLDKSLMQQIATENNLSEAAFFVKTNDKFDLKWFTPIKEVDLCGHGTLASAFVLYEFLKYEKEEIIFNSNSGELKVRKAGDYLELNFPSKEVSKIECPQKLIEGIGIKPKAVYKANWYLVELANEQEVLSVKPDFASLLQLDAAVIITAPGNSSDFVSRFFGPKAGINEDPVTGSAHCLLVPIWAKKLNKKSLHALQLSQGKGELFCEFLGDRVTMKGKAVLYLKGEIEI